MTQDEIQRALGRDGWLTVLGDFDEALSERDLDPISLIVIGGAAMALAHGDRATTDIDVVSDKLPEPYRHAARDIAEAHAIRQDWLNDGAKGFAPSLIGSEPHRVVFDGRRLQILTPPATYLLATKLRAAREQDLGDVHKLMSLSQHTGEEQLLHLLERAYPATQLTSRMEYFARSAAAQYAPD